MLNMTGVVGTLKTIKISNSKKDSLSLLIIHINDAYFLHNYITIVFIVITINFNFEIFEYPVYSFHYVKWSV